MNRLFKLQDNARAAFRQWASHHGKTYPASTSESEERFQLWKDNVREHLTSQQRSKVLLNGLMDIHDEEFRQSYLGHSPRRSSRNQG